MLRSKRSIAPTAERKIRRRIPSAQSVSGHSRALLPEAWKDGSAPVVATPTMPEVVSAPTAVQAKLTQGGNSQCSVQTVLMSALIVARQIR